MAEISDVISLIKRLSLPYAQGYAHVQGPGGNTSVKFDGRMMIKASGFTFSDVAKGNGYAVVNIADVFSDGRITGKKAAEIVVCSNPPNSRPSMEFQFHAMLANYVLHTHSVYADVVLCADSSDELLKDIFSGSDFLLLPYVTPGLPIAQQLLSQLKKEKLPSVIFLKNHGIIVHHDDLDETLGIYNHAQQQIKAKLSLPNATDEFKRIENKQDVELLIPAGDLQFLSDGQLTEAVLIPDQSVFFRDKTGYSKSENKPVTIDAEKRIVSISGTPKFTNAGIEMLQAVLYIRRELKRLGLQPQFLKAEDIADIHGLESEKHRISTLN